MNTIQEYLLQYAHRNLIDTEKRSQLLEQLFEEYPHLNLEHTQQDINVSILLLDHEILNTKRAPKNIDHVFNINIADMVLTENNNTVWTTLFNTHMDYISSQARQEVAKKIL